MSIMLFADLETLRLALASGVIPPEIRRTPANSGRDKHGRRWVQSHEVVPREMAAGLARLGVPVFGSESEIVLEPVSCWPQLLPLEQQPFPKKAEAVLFELPAGKLARLTAEIIRLSPHSELAFRSWDFHDSSATVLVRATQPPLFSLLTSAFDGAVVAFAEQAPRVWVEVGFRHPLAEQIEATDGQIVLLRPPALWRYRDNVPFAGELPVFALPPAKTENKTLSLPQRLQVPLRLVDAGVSESPELWVIQDRPLERLAVLAAESAAAFLSRFQFALVETQGRTTLLLWALPSKRALPVLMLPALGFRSYQKLTNVFLPCGRRMQPLPRRDALRRLFGDDPRRLIVLVPDGANGFTSVQVAKQAFHPLEAILEYTAGQSIAPLQPVLAQPLTAWANFAELNAVEPDFDRSPEAAPIDPGPGIYTSFRRRAIRDTSVLTRLRGGFRRLLQRHGTFGNTEAGLAEKEAAEFVPAFELGVRRHDLQERRAVLEQRFLLALGVRGSAERRAVLPELASLHAQLGNFGDAAVCWLNAAWEQEPPPNYWLWGWLQVEKKLGRSPYAENDVLAHLDGPASPAAVRNLAAGIVWLSRQDSVPQALSAKAGELRVFLEANERWLPIRAAWLAQVGLARMAGGDALALARTRDRLIGQLARHGLSLELDVPSFLRFEGRGASERFTFVREWLVRVRDPIHRWVDQMVRHRPADYCRALLPRFPDQAGRCTKAFVDLMLAWGLARLGEHGAARRFEKTGREILDRFDDPVLGLLGAAYCFRIEQALDGLPSTGPLPPKLLAQLERSAPDPNDDDRLLARYRIDVLRGRSGILEPSERISPVRPIAVRLTADPPDPEPPLGWAGAELHRQIAMLAQASPHMDQVTHALTLEQAFDTAGRLGDIDAARSLTPLLARLFSPAPPRFGNLAQQLLQPPFGEGYRPEELQRLEAMPAQCLRSLRRLGLLADAERYRVPAVEWVLHGEPLAQLRRVQSLTWISGLRALLHLVTDWFGHADEERAVTVLDAARTSLLYVSEIPPLERLSLACAYTAALGQAAGKLACGRIEELFRDLTGLYDVRQTNSHFSLSPLVLVDAVVRTVVNENVSLPPAARRWLDEDEFRVRRRMQEDLRALTESH